MSAKSWRSVLLAGVAAVLGSIIGGNTPAVAGSDNNPRTYAGDYQGGSLPIGTFIAFQYEALRIPMPSSIPPDTRCRARTPILGSSLRA
jgi:hypothetical protein